MNIRRQKRKRKRDRKSSQIRRRIVFGGIAVLVAALNVAAWNSAAFSDWYIAHVFPIWVNTYGRLTGLFPFSVGEWLLAVGVVLVMLALALGIVWMGIGVAAGFGVLVRRILLREGKVFAEADVSWREKAFVEADVSRREKAFVEADVLKIGKVSVEAEALVEGKASVEAEALMEGKASVEEEAIKEGKVKKGRAFCVFLTFCKGFYAFFVWTLLLVSLIMTLNCFILYHASTFSEHYFGANESEYTLEELIQVYNMVAEQCNSLAKVMERDENGMVIYSGSMGKNGVILDMADMARELMQQLGETYSQLDGYYPRPKALLSSDFMCQQYMQGYYFPFSMEANYNDVMHILNIPSTMCHELAHLRGYIYEDEANFIGYLACVQSEDAFFQYAGYLSVLNYLNNDLYRARENNLNAYEAAVALVPPVVVDDQVWTDNIFVTQEEWDRINGKALIDTEIVDAAADVFIDTNLKVNGIADGVVSYSRVVKLLLQYYKQS